MIIQNLQSLSIPEINKLFNAAFADYLLPLQLSEEEFRMKMKSENISPENSAGVFFNGQPVGFMLIAIDESGDEKVAYNAGTGVIPKYRGQQLSEKMYGFLFEFLYKKGIFTHQLEVITQNGRAISVYEKSGFIIKRSLSCFKGNISLPLKAVPAEIRTAAIPKEQQIQSFSNLQPTYQNSMCVIKRIEAQHHCLTAYSDNRLVGYLIFSVNARIKQFAVHPSFRRKGIASRLFAEMQQLLGDKIISVINVDENDAGTIAFLSKTGMELTLRQYEMEKKLH